MPEYEHNREERIDAVIHEILSSKDNVNGKGIITETFAHSNNFAKENKSGENLFIPKLCIDDR